MNRPRVTTLEELLRNRRAWKALSSLTPAAPRPITLADVLPPIEVRRACAGCRERSYSGQHAKACPLAGAK